MKFALFLSLWTFQAWSIGPLENSTVETKCYKLPSQLSITGDYCLSHYPESQNTDYLYYWHGIQGSEKNWTKRHLNQLIRSHWLKKGFHPPKVIALSYGKRYLFNPSRKEKNHYKVTLKQVMPFIEKKHQLKGNRLLLGMSMGAFNGLQMTLRNPDLFQKVAFLCPPLTTVSPYASKEKLKMFRKKSGANTLLFNIAVSFSRSFFSSQKIWEKEGPLSYAQENLFSDFPSTYMFVAKNDEYGFYLGGVEFSKIAQERMAEPFKLTVSNSAGHCKADPQKVADHFVNEDFLASKSERNSP